MEQKLWFVTDEYATDEPGLFLHNSSEAAIYWFLRLKGGGTRIQIVDGTQMHSRTAERGLKGLRDRGVVQGH